MSKINFISSWDKFGRSTWSGTPFGIYSALSAKVSVTFFNAAQKNQNGVIGLIDKVINRFTMGMLNVKQGEAALDKSDTVSNNVPCIIFSEYRSKYLKNSYCYQDLSVDFVLRAKQADKKSLQSFDYIPLFAMKRKKQQADLFYQECAGVFTMSQWLKKDLVEKTGVPERKVHFIGGGCNVDVSKIDYARKEGRRFIFVGRDWKRKNGDLVVEAFLSLIQKLPQYNAELYILGPGKCPKSALGKKNIYFKGNVGPEELAEYYKSILGSVFVNV